MGYYFNELMKLSLKLVACVLAISGLFAFLAFQIASQSGTFGKLPRDLRSLARDSLLKPISEKPINSSTASGYFVEAHLSDVNILYAQLRELGFGYTSSNDEAEIMSALSANERNLLKNSVIRFKKSGVTKCYVFYSGSNSGELRDQTIYLAFLYPNY